MKSHISIDLSDPRREVIAEVLSNKKTIQVLDALVEKDLSESELSGKLGIPISTVHYSVKKLVAAGLVEPASKFFWSSKGKKVILYRAVNKQIIISPRSLKRGVVPALIATGVLALGLRLLVNGRETSQAILKASDSFAYGASTSTEPMIGGSFYTFLASAPDSWAWFFMGGLVALVIFMLWNYFHKE